MSLTIRACLAGLTVLCAAVVAFAGDFGYVGGGNHTATAITDGLIIPDDVDWSGVAPSVLNSYIIYDGAGKFDVVTLLSAYVGSAVTLYGSPGPGPIAVAEGSLLVGGALYWEALAKGAVNSALMSNGTTPFWDNTPEFDGIILGLNETITFNAGVTCKHDGTDIICNDSIRATGFIGEPTADPLYLHYDSEGDGADLADKEAGGFFCDLIDTTEDSEDSDCWFTNMEGGTRTNQFWFDESLGRWIIPTGKGLRIGTNNWDNGSDLIDSAAIATEVRSKSWGGESISVQGSCAVAEATPLASGPELDTVICTDADADTFQGSTMMPDSWDGGTVVFTMGVTQTAADTDVIEVDFGAQCVSNDEAISAWASPPTGEQPASITLTAASDWLEDDTPAVTVAGTSCAGGDMLYWIGSVDATATTSSELATLHIVGVKMEYTSNVGD